MKKIIYILITIMLYSCDSKDASDCFQTVGTRIQQEVVVDSFENILVNRDIELIVKEGDQVQVIIETGDNLMNDVEAIVIDNELQLTDHNTCNYTREYGSTQVFVTAPDIKKIRSSTQYDIASDGVLNYSDLELICEDFNNAGSFTVGDFRLEINTENLRVIANNISTFYISGQVDDLFIGFYSGAGRFHGENLMAQNIDVFHRGSNDMFVNPQQSLSGELRGTGNLISLNQPSILEVERFYTGQLIFQ